MTAIDATTCPQCGARLTLEGLGQSTWILCARCRRPFAPALLTAASTRRPPALSQPLEATPPTHSPALRATIPVGRSGWAIAAGYLGLFSLLPIFGLAAIWIGILALRDLRRHPHKHGRPRAIFALALGALTSLFYLGLLLYECWTSGSDDPTH